MQKRVEFSLDPDQDAINEAKLLEFIPHKSGEMINLAFVW